MRLVNMIILSTKLDNLLQLFGVSVLFIFVLAITYLTTRFVGGVKLKKDKNSNFKVIETYKITNNKFLQIINIGDKYVVISVSKDDIHFITEINEEQIHKIEPMMTSNLGNFSKYNFSDILDKMNIKQKEKNDQETDGE
jgi:flagellar protein FliO/FliZ